MKTISYKYTSSIRMYFGLAVDHQQVQSHQQSHARQPQGQGLNQSQGHQHPNPPHLLHSSKEQSK